MSSGGRTASIGGVRPGYKVGVRRELASRGGASSVTRQALVTCRQAARELAGFVADEIVCATMDTIRVWRALRPTRRTVPRREARLRQKVYVPSFESGVFVAEPVRVYDDARRPV